VAYNAVNTLVDTLDRIPDEVWSLVEEVCVFDDASHDETRDVGLSYRRSKGLDKLKIYRNEKNQGYGGNQKLAYRYALTKGYDIAVLLHGDGQYAPEVMMDLLKPLLRGEAQAVMGSRMMLPGGALKGGMPLYKYVGNKILSGFENFILTQNLSEYHSGYRAYDLHTLSQIPIQRNSNDFHFDTQIIIQLLISGAKIVEVPIPTYYGDEICYVNGLKYAYNVTLSVISSKLHVLGLKYKPEYEINKGSMTYPFGSSSPGSGSLKDIKRIAAMIPEGCRVLDVGCHPRHLSAHLLQKGCIVDIVDPSPGATALRAPGSEIEASLSDNSGVGKGGGHADLKTGERYDRIVIANQLEHLPNPSHLLIQLRKFLKKNGRIIASTENSAQWPLKIGSLFGRFTGTSGKIVGTKPLRLYTEDSFTGLFVDCGFAIVSKEVTGMQPEEFQPALQSNRFVKEFHRVYDSVAKHSPKLLAYQILLEAERLEDPLDQVLKQSGV